jgi:hypothetical protein
MCVQRIVSVFRITVVVVVFVVVVCGCGAVFVVCKSEFRDVRAGTSTVHSRCTWQVLTGIMPCLTFYSHCAKSGILPGRQVVRKNLGRQSSGRQKMRPPNNSML